MRTQQIPLEQWTHFLNELSERHQGDHVDVELRGRETAGQAAHDVPLHGISFDPKGSEGRKIEVMAGDSESHLTHFIAAPVQVRLAQTDEGEDSALEIDSAEGPSTLVRFLPRVEGAEPGAAH